jgi:TolB-like protein/DNA-binding SARP family transcriptional activator/Tfp pilus assembly protein PilF
MPLEFRVLGPVEVARENRRLALESPKQRALLALLVLHPRRALSPDRILAEVWPHATPASGVKTLRYHISKLRDVLHEIRDDVLVTSPQGYALQIAPEQIDAVRFERLLEEARRLVLDQPERGSRLLRDALALWRGDAFDDLVTYPFAAAEASRLDSLRLDALEERIEADLACGRHAEVVNELERLVALQPLRERLTGQLMLAQYRLGRQADALRSCQRLRRSLAEELGIDPGHDIKQLEERILVHDPSLVVGPPPPAQASGVRAPVLTSIVVLPFENLNAGEEDRFFADGLTEELIHALARVDGLRVISRASAFALREQAADVREIGRQLRAEAVVAGSVRRTGERVRISAELVEVRDGYQLWSGRYDRDRADIFVVQEEVAQAITSALTSRLDRRPVIAVPRHTTNMDAYDAFLQGRYFWHQQTAEGILQAISLFERAVSLDPVFGQAYAWLAIVRTYSTIFGYTPPGESLPPAREEAKRAIALEPTLTVAHLTLGLVSQYADWDWAATERHYRHAVELSPGDATARAWFGVFLARLGRSEEAVAQSAAALDLDPLAHEASWLYLIVLTHLGRHAEAAALGHKAATVHPRSPHIHWPTGMAHLGLDEPEQALECIGRALECEPSNPYARAFEIRALAQSGRTAQARQRLESLKQEKLSGYFSPFILAIAQLAQGDHDEAISLLGEAIKVGDPMMPFINHWGMSPLADDPRYQVMLDALGLPNLFASEHEEDRTTATSSQNVGNIGEATA